MVGTLISVKPGEIMKKENLEVILEDMNTKFSLILESHEALRSEIIQLTQKTDERFDLVAFEIRTLNQKIDGVDQKLDKKIDGLDLKLSKKLDALSADLSAHRADTEAHHGVYRVKECEPEY
jgi:outer membrane murein-binding lipoprotein Lpp